MAFTQDQLQQALSRYQGASTGGFGGTWANPEPPPAPVVQPQASAAPPAALLQQPVQPPPEPVQLPVAEPMPAPGQPPQQSVPPTFDTAIADYQTAAKREADAVRADADLQAQALEQQGAIAQEQAKELAARQRAFEAEQAERAQARDETLAEFQALQEQATNMRVVDRRTTSQRVMGTIALALGAVGDGVARLGGDTSTNHAAQIQQQLDAQIERDLEMQREAIGDKRKAAAVKLTELGLARTAFQDEQSAEEFATAQVQLKYAAELKGAAMRTSNQAARSAAEIAATGMETKASSTIAQLVERRDEQKMRSRLLSRSGGGGGGGKKKDDEPTLTKGQLEAIPPDQRTADQSKQLKYIYDSEQAGRKPAETAEDRAVRAATDPVRAATEKGARLSNDLVVRDPKIAPLYAKDPNKLQKQVDSSREMVTLIDQALKLRKDNPVKSHLWGTDVRGSLQSIGTAIQLNGKNVYELGALSGPDMGLVEGIAGNPASFLDINEAKLKQLKSDLIRGTGSALKTRGFEAPNLGSDEPPPRSSASSQQERIRAAVQAAKDQSAPSDQPKPFKVYGTPRR